MRMKQYGWLAGAALLLVAADWLSKFWVFSRIPRGETVSVIDGWFYLAHRQNTGVAFSMFADLPPAWGTPVLALVGVAGVVLFAWMMSTTADRIVHIASTLVIAGAIGNLGDRLLNGGVTDFIYVSFFPFVFNIADAAITVGGALLVLRMIFPGNADETAAAPERSVAG